jgi:nicotinamidase-related amidase
VLPTGETAILICDMWDRHWCRGATERVAAMVPRMNRLVERARAAGVQIIHAPSDTVDFYRQGEHAQRVLSQAPAKLPAEVAVEDAPLPIDDSDEGCDTGEKPFKAWTRQHAGIDIAGNDVISDKGPFVLHLLQQKGIRNLVVMGVHTNMCVLNRSFAIKQMTKWGIQCLLVRDLTDAMYNPAMPPRVSHKKGTELVIRHIERYWAPSVTSGELLRAIAAAK